MNVKRMLAVLLAAVMALSVFPAYSAADFPAGYESPGCPSETAQTSNEGNHYYNCSGYQPATCAAAGQAQFTCIYCGDTQSRSYASLEHTWGEWERKTDPSCAEPGYDARRCAVCGAEEERAVPAVGHDWGDWQDMEYPTCEDYGLRTKFCARCGESVSEPIQPSGHHWSDWKMDEPGTCVQYRMLVHVCTICGLKTWQYGAYGDHQWGDWEIIRYPDENGPGLKRRVCLLNSEHSETEDYYGDTADQVSKSGPESAFQRDVTFPPVPGDDPADHDAVPGGLYLSAFCTVSEPFYFDSDRQTTAAYTLFVVNTGSEAVELSELETATASKVSKDGMAAAVLKPGEFASYSVVCTFSETVMDSEDRLYVAFTVSGAAEDGAAAVSNTVKLAHAASRELPPRHPEPETAVKMNKYVSSSSLYPEGFAEGETMEFRVSVTNTSETVIPSLEIWDEMYSLTEPVDVMNDLAPGETRETAFPYTVTVKDAEFGCIVNAAAAVWTDPVSETKLIDCAFCAAPATAAENSDPSRYGVDIGISFDQPPANGSFYEEGEAFPVTVTWVNKGEEPLYHVNVFDDMADCLDPGPASGGWLAEDEALAPGESASFTYTYIVDSSDAAYGYAADQARITALDAHGWESLDNAFLSAPAGGADACMTVEMTETSSPGPDGYYEPGEVISYRIICTNVSEETLADICLYDTLSGSVSFSGFSPVKLMEPNESRTFSFKYTVTKADAENGWVVNGALVTFSTDTMKDVPVPSGLVYSPAVPVLIAPAAPAQDGEADEQIPPVTAVPGEGDITGGIAPGSGAESCAFTLDASGGAMVLYSLKPCQEHGEIAKKMEECLASDSESAWDSARGLWQSELDKMYQKLLDASFGEARQAVMNDRLAFRAMLNAYEAMNGQRAETAGIITGMLMRRCCELCYALRHAPESRPDSVLNGTYQRADAEAAEQCGLILEAAEGGYRIGLSLCGKHGGIQESILALLKDADPDQYENLFQGAARLWQSALDARMNPRYKAADAENRQLIAQWHRSVDAMTAAHSALLAALYPDDPRTAAELAARDWQEIALTVCGE